jgi:hypothetical protein
MGAVSNVRSAAAALALMLAAASVPASQVPDDEHPFVMPGTPAKTIPAPTPWLTGAQLLRQLEQGDASAVEYVKGVYDATESGLWCYTGRTHVKLRKQSPEAMRADAVAYLRKLKAAQRKERASDHLVRMWQIRWPCPPDHCCP